MAIPSLEFVLSNTAKTFLRFPLVMLCAVTGTLSMITLIDNPVNGEIELTKITMLSMLGLVAFVVHKLWVEFYNIKPALAWATAFVVVMLLVVYYYCLGASINEGEVLQYIVLNAVLHLMVSVIWFIKHKPIDDFWSFNKNLFLRVFQCTIYCGTLIAGLNFALLAVDTLFKANIDGETYAQLAFVVLGIFNTLFFLAGVPQLNNITTKLEYPKGLKNFTQFVLVPLVLLYMGILLVYESKILIEFSLPKGWVSTLVLVFSVLGILSLLLVYPLRNEDENKWIKQLWKWFFWLVIPLLGLLYWAILYRINLYGITTERYYVLLLAIWLTIITAYSLLKPNYHIRLIPISLAIVGLFSLYGPQSALAVSKYSQTNRLKNLLAIHHTKQLSFDERKELSSVASFLFDNYDKTNLQAQFPKAFNNSLADDSLTVTDILKSENITYINRYQTIDDEYETEYFSSNLKHNELYPKPDFDYMWLFNNDDTSAVTVLVKNNPQLKSVSVKNEQHQLLVLIDGERIVLPLANTLQYLAKNTELSEHSSANFTLEGETNRYKLSYIIHSISGNTSANSDSTELTDIDGIFYLKVK